VGGHTSDWRGGGLRVDYEVRNCLEIEKEFSDASNFVAESAPGAHNVLQVCRSALQCVAVFYSVLQRAAMWCNFVVMSRRGAHNELQVCCKCVAVCCSVLQCVAVCCSVLQCVAVCRSVLQCVAVCCSVLQCAAVCCNFVVESGRGAHNELQVCCKYVAVCCCGLQCVSVRCSALQCAAEFCNFVSEATPVAHNMTICYVLRYFAAVLQIYRGALQRVAVCPCVLLCGADSEFLWRIPRLVRAVTSVLQICCSVLQICGSV